LYPYACMCGCSTPGTTVEVGERAHWVDIVCGGSVVQSSEFSGGAIVVDFGSRSQGYAEEFVQAAQRAMAAAAAR
jgi:hypothetical protein